MDSNKQNLREQDAPLKNTDHAFVQVGHNGEPVLPHEKEKEQQPVKNDQTDDPAKTTLEDR